MAKAPYYIIVTLKNQVLMSFLKVRVIVNDRDIYLLQSNQPVVIPIEQDNPRIVVTDGYHFTRPVKLSYKKPGYFNFNIVCAIDDAQLIIGGVTLGMLYLLGFWTGFFLLKLLSFLPLLLLLVSYYFTRRTFLRIRKA